MMMMIPAKAQTSRVSARLMTPAVLLVTFSLLCWQGADAAATATAAMKRTLDETIHEEDLEVEPPDYILFPFFVQAIGIIVCYLTTYVFGRAPLPYTAIMFLIGMAMGIGAQKLRGDNPMARSILGWADIDSELLLLTFLPGLVFWDSLNTNRYLFYKSFSQIMILAFPAVLAGTCLTALIFYYIFPYGWSFNLSMAVGSSLSATDPVAVAALIDEVGAPPRLQLLIGGESMFNDGSAIVFFTIFSESFFHELGLPNFGEDIDVARGFAIFFRMAGGGTAIGIAYGFTLICMLSMLDRRLSSESNLVEITTTLTVAYLTFYTSEIICGCSGVIAVVCCGIFTNAFGYGYINDPVLLKNYWGTLEHLLNTLLFCLGGVVWGRVIADPTLEDSFGGRDWGYLILLFVLLNVIRFLLVGVLYPLISRIGLKSNWQESVFLAYGGLRGAVGIALAIAIDNDVRKQTNDPEILALTNKAFGFVGGIAFLTLIVNGSTAGPLLIKLGLAKSTETRKRVLKHFKISLARVILKEYANMVTKPLFQKAKLSLVAHHIPFFDFFTADEIQAAVDKRKSEVGGQELTEDGLPDMRRMGSSNALESKPDAEGDVETPEATPPPERALNRKSLELPDMNKDDKTRELRLIFLELLSTAYEKQKKHGYLDAREDDGFVYIVLKLSLEIAQDGVNRGGPLNDWECCQTFVKNTSKVEKLIEGITKPTAYAQSKKVSLEYQKSRIDLHRTTAFLYAHSWSRKRLEVEFVQGSNELKEAAEQVCVESKLGSEKAESLYKGMDISENDRSTIIAHYVAAVLLNKMANFVEKTAADGLVTGKEAEEMVVLIEKEINVVHSCSKAHTDE